MPDTPQPDDGNALAARLMQRLEARTARIGVIGLGYIGLPLAATAATAGFSVTGFDIDPEKIKRLDAHDSYIEAVTDTALAEFQRARRLDWTLDFNRLAEMDVIVICVPTPLTQHREPDLSFVENTAREIAKRLSPGALVVLESTTFPGTTAEVLTPILASSGLEPAEEFFVAFSPEREDPGNSDFRTQTIPKIVAGEGAAAGRLVAAFYGGVVDKVVPVSSTQTAEAIKITENIFRAVNIALVNELKVIYDAMGIDVWEVIDGAATKPFGFMPFYPGPGLGGHCIPIDPFYLSWKAREHNLTARFIELAGEINVQMPDYVIGRAREALDKATGKGLRGARILIVGVAYKKNVSDMRESPSARLMEMLLAQGADVDFIDPHVPEIPRMRAYPHLLGRKSVDPAGLAPGRYDLVLIATDHDAIDYAGIASLGAPIVDTRNAFARRGLPLGNVLKA